MSTDNVVSINKNSEVKKPENKQTETKTGKNQFIKHPGETQLRFF